MRTRQLEQKNQRCVANKYVVSNMHLHADHGTDLDHDSNCGKFKLVDTSEPTWVEST